MRKTVAVVALDDMASKFYESQVRELFGDMVETSSYSVLSNTVKELKRADLLCGVHRCL
jgi:hypothetical protein